MHAQISAQNNDGQREIGDVGLANVLVELLDASDNVLRSFSTSSTGLYTFDDLVQGTYVVRFTAAGKSGVPQNAADDTVDSDADPVTGRTDALSITASADITNVDAGFAGDELLTEALRSLTDTLA